MGSFFRIAQLVSVDPGKCRGNDGNPPQWLRFFVWPGLIPATDGSKTNALVMASVCRNPKQRKQDKLPIHNPTALKYRLPTAPIVRLENLGKIYRSGDRELVIFRELSLEVAVGEQIAIIGESGAGKSTLLHLISGLDRASEGSIYYKDKNLTGLPEPELASFRNREIGYVWQQHHLLPEFTAVENAAMPLLIRGESRPKAMAAALSVLDEVGLGDRAEHRAGELSGGEQQRIAIARALTGDPSLLLADEPTGNLDERTGQMIFNLLSDLRRKRNLTTVLVTHNLQFARCCDRVLRLKGGALHAVPDPAP
jgi:lipoprotein-releasing system ATP-binding protein